MPLSAFQPPPPIGAKQAQAKGEAAKSKHLGGSDKPLAA